MEEAANVKHLFFFWSAGPSTGASTELAARWSLEECLNSGCVDTVGLELFLWFFLLLLVFWHC